MIKGTVKDWLRLTEKIIEKDIYGMVSTCEFCIFVGGGVAGEYFRHCRECLVPKLCTGYCRHVEETQDVKTDILELKIALESYIKEN